MQVSVIFSTYNAPEWLEKALWGWLAQDYKDFELVIADDGSTADTRDLIERVRAESEREIRHVWQPDEGFRKCAILNKAIGAARGDYLVFSDGDCIPRADFVATHVRLARPGRYLTGGYFKLPREVSQLITREDIVTGRVFEPQWLGAHGLHRGVRMWKLEAHGWVAHVLNHLSPAEPTFHGHNSSAWKADILAVNGYDERMGYGGEDTEFGYRLVHAGTRPYQIRYSTICLHLEHERGYASREGYQASLARRHETLRSRAKGTAHGIVKGERE